MPACLEHVNVFYKKMHTLDANFCRIVRHDKYLKKCTFIFYVRLFKYLQYIFEGNLIFELPGAILEDVVVMSHSEK